MKQLLSAIAVCLLAASPAAAINLGDTNKNTNTNVNSNTNINSNTAIAAQQQGQMQGQAQGQKQSQANSQTMNVNDRLQAVPASAPSMSSGHPCQKMGVSVGLGLVGGGGSLGAGGEIDEACMLAQMGYNEAATIMIAKRSPEAREALIAAGNIAPAPTAEPVASTRSAPKTSPVVYTSCKFDGDAIRVGVKRGASDATRARAVAQCKNALR